MGLKPIVVINKVDRSDARPTEVANEVFDLFAALDATEEQLDFPILYGSAKQGWMAASAEGPKDQGMAPLFDLVVRHVAPPQVEEGPFRMLGTILEANPYLGPHRHRPDIFRQRQTESDGQGARPPRQSGRGRAASPRYWPFAVWSAPPIDEAERAISSPLRVCPRLSCRIRCAPP